MCRIIRVSLGKIIFFKKERKEEHTEMLIPHNKCCKSSIFIKINKHNFK